MFHDIYKYSIDFLILFLLINIFFFYQQCSMFSSVCLYYNRIFCRLLLPYERYQRGEDTKVRLNHGRRTKSMSGFEDSDVKEEPSDSYPSKTPPPIETISATTISPLQPIISTATTVNGALI